jgi:murein DD-endopeptidase MepM/ murein hydrolase activator NlpD
LRSLKDQIEPVVPFDLNSDKVLLLDLTANNRDLAKLDLRNTVDFNEYIFGLMSSAGAEAAIGGYNEDRNVYHRSLQFAGDSVHSRTIHLGVDIWAPAHTPVFAPLNGHIHSFRNNAAFGDYGPTVILEHAIQGSTFYTLYGHLSEASIKNLTKGQSILKGQKIAEFGDFPINGDWPPHLHFQVMTNMLGKEGDFPGVCSSVDREMYLNICPDPNLILRSKHLIKKSQS